MLVTLSGKVTDSITFSRKALPPIVVTPYGTVTAVNEAVHDDYAVINNDPFGEGWLFEVEVDEAGELMDAAAYASANGLD